MDLVRVLAVGTSPTSCEAWQRRVGGVLKGLAFVCKGVTKDIKRLKPDLVAYYQNGEEGQLIKQEVEGTGFKILGLNLVLMPVSIRVLYQISREKRIGVVKRHLRCANMLLSEIIASGIYENHFITGTYDEMQEMEVDVFVTTEETSTGLKSAKPLINVARCLSPYSIAILLNTVNEISRDKYQKEKQAI